MGEEGTCAERGPCSVEEDSHIFLRSNGCEVGVQACNVLRFDRIVLLGSFEDDPGNKLLDRGIHAAITTQESRLGRDPRVHGEALSPLQCP